MIPELPEVSVHAACHAVPPAGRDVHDPERITGFDANTVAVAQLQVLKRRDVDSWSQAGVGAGDTWDIHWLLIIDRHLAILGRHALDVDGSGAAHRVRDAI